MIGSLLFLQVGDELLKNIIYKRIFDSLIQEELGYYKDILRENGVQGLIDQFL